MRRTLAVAAVALSALLLVGCTANSSGSDAVAPAPGVVDSSGGVKAPEMITPEGQAVSGYSQVIPGNRDVITTGSVSLTVADPIESAEDAVAITERVGGRIDSRSENPKTPNQPASASLSLRIPSDRLDEALADLRELGTVNFVTLNKSDVTQQTQDLDARITSLRTSVDRLLALMAQSTTTTDLIAIESALSSRQAELESLQSQRTYLADQVDYATISLELQPVGTVAPGTPDTFWGAIIAGWNALIAALGGLVVGIGFALPWLLALGVLAFLVLLALRLARRRRSSTDSPTGPSGPTAPPGPAAPTTP